MDQSQAIVELITSQKWLALAALLIGLVVRSLKDDTFLPTVPAKYRPWLALGLGVVSGVLDKVIAGGAWVPSIVAGLVAGLLAIAGHDTIIEGLRGGKELGAKSKPTEPPGPLGVAGSILALFFVFHATAGAHCTPEQARALIAAEKAACIAANALIDEKAIQTICGLTDAELPMIVQIAKPTREKVAAARLESAKVSAPKCGDAGATDGH